MKNDEFAFLNQQLAGMLRAGIPLEGALKQLVTTMGQGASRAQWERLEADLANGVPLAEAVGRRAFPEFYVRMLQLGVESRDLPGMLTLLADHYSARHALWVRLKALMVYPAIVLAAALSLSVFFVCLYRSILGQAIGSLAGGWSYPAIVPALLWVPVGWLVLVTVGCLLALGIPSWREWLRWRVPGFKEASLAQFASAMRVLLARGGQLREAIDLLRRIEQRTALGPELARWEERLAAGYAKFTEFAAGSSVFPGLFVWLVGQGRENLAAGFGHAAEIYSERAKHRVEMLLYAFLPVAVLVLGALIFLQVFCMLSALTGLLNALGGD